MYIGGFDEAAGDQERDGSALVLVYPHDDDGQLPSIDLRRDRAS